MGVHGDIQHHRGEGFCKFLERLMWNLSNAADIDDTGLNG
jgi:hypothetical protein